MNDSTIRGILILLALSGWKLTSSPRTSSSRSPGMPQLPPGIPPQPEPTDEEIDATPSSMSYPGYADLLWIQYAQDPKRPGPPLGAMDRLTSQVARKLTDFERWALAPFFPVAADLDHIIHNGDLPPELKGQDVDQRLQALTHPTSGEIYVPFEPKPLWHRYWLSVLAHEMTHAAQLRMGMTIPQGLEALRQYGYTDSPIERQARWQQHNVAKALYAKARDFYRSKK